MYKVNGSLGDYTDLELALLVLLNCFGSGSSRKSALGSRYSDVQKIVNQILISKKVNPVYSGAGIDEAKIREVFAQYEPTAEEYEEFINEFLNALKEE